MLSERALSLIRDVFERPGLFRRAHRITRRSVSWGREAEPVSRAHAAVVVSERELLSELEQVLDPLHDHLDHEADFTVVAAGPLPTDPVEYRFGSPSAHAAQIRLRNPHNSASCWIESLEDGWLFLIPDAADSGWFLSGGSSPPTVLGRAASLLASESRL